MGKKTKKRYANYLKDFRCIGGECEDSCCVGWDIDIDKATFRQYFKVQDQEMKKMFQKNVHNNENSISSEIDYGRVKLAEGKRCPFLDCKNYCVIHSKLGEDYLSNVCSSFPRIVNKIDGCYEMSLDVSCPEAARILLGQQDGIELVDNKETLGKHIISSEIDTSSKQFKESPVKYFKEIREQSINIIKNRKLDLNKRLHILGEFINRLEDEFQENPNNVQKFIREYDINKVQDENESNDLNYILQVDFFKKLIGFLKVEKQVESELFKKHTKEIVDAFKLEEGKELSENLEIYKKAFESYNENCMNKYEYIFENYLVNFMYNNMFPFTESEEMFDGYIMLLTRYSFIKFYLVGKYLNSEEESKDNITEFIQVFSKVIGHHKTYLVDVLRFLKGREFDNMEFAKMFL